MAARTLVTGATGFVGTRLVHALLGRGRSVRGFAHRGPQRPPEGNGGADMEFVRADLLDPAAVDAAVSGCETVFHCAAIVPGRGSDEQTWAVNVTGTGNVVDACVRHKVRRLVYVSTDSVYGDSETIEAAEDAPLQTAYFKEGNYPQSKLEGEHLVHRAAAEHGLDAVILRPCMIYGPGPSPATELFAQWRAKRVKMLLGGGASRLSILYVDDLVDALLLAESVPAASGNTYNISDGKIYPKREILGQLIGLCGRPNIVLPLPGAPLEAAFAVLHPFVQAVAPALADSVDVRRVQFAVEDHTIDCRKAIRELGYAPRVFLAEGLARTVAWLADHPDGKESVA